MLQDCQVNTFNIRFLNKPQFHTYYEMYNESGRHARSIIVHPHNSISAIIVQLFLFIVFSLYKKGTKDDINLKTGKNPRPKEINRQTDPGQELG
jgi:hypothetical protein